MERQGSRVPRISLIVCTYNGAGLLPRCLVAARTQTLPAADREIIVVDNGSSDHTHAIVRQWPDVRYLYSPLPGLSQARNVGAYAARSPIVAFIDDDAIAAPDLLEQLLAAFDARPDAGCVGGRIEARLPPNPPAWYSPHFAGHYSEFDPGHRDLTRLQQLAEFPFGANVAYRREALERARYFNETLGRVGKGNAGGEELDLECRLAQLGYGIYYQPRARVDHIIMPERLRWPHIANTAKAAGRNWAYYEIELLRSGWRVAGDLRMLAGALWRTARRQNTYVAYSQSIFYRAKILRKLRYLIGHA